MDDRLGFSRTGDNPNKIHPQPSSITNSGWTCGLFCKRERDVIKISSGSKALNAILGGGFETKSITEIHGEYR